MSRGHSDAEAGRHNEQSPWILVDSSVWIDYLRGKDSWQTNRLDSLLDSELLAIPAANNCRKLRSLGKTVRGTINVVLATRCIVSGHALLHDDRDFDAFEAHLGLRCVGANA